MDIHGKNYMEVKDRVNEFRNDEQYKGWALRSDITHMDGDTVIIKAFIVDEEDRLIATGIASETKGSSPVNKTSHIENCETSAWGRALGNLGIGVLDGIASKDEVEIARAAEGSLSDKQIAVLKKNNKWKDGMSFQEGRKALDEIFNK